jgi:hypothetical protein
MFLTTYNNNKVELMRMTKRVAQILEFMTEHDNEEDWIRGEIGDRVTADGMAYLLDSNGCLKMDALHRKIHTDSVRRTMTQMVKAGIIYTTSEVLTRSGYDGDVNRRTLVYRLDKGFSIEECDATADAVTGTVSEVRETRRHEASDTAIETEYDEL